MVILVMGISGIGKTTIGKALAEELGWTFLDADDDHSDAAKAKMSHGEGLTDADRWPWLERVRADVQHHIDRDENIVLACSALKHSYRKFLRDVSTRVVVVQLTAPVEIVAERLRHRHGHFAGVSLLGSQVHDLEPSHDAVKIDASGSVPDVVAAIRREVGV